MAKVNIYKAMAMVEEERMWREEEKQKEQAQKLQEEQNRLALKKQEEERTNRENEACWNALWDNDYFWHEYYSNLENVAKETQEEKEMFDEVVADMPDEYYMFFEDDEDPQWKAYVDRKYLSHQSQAYRRQQKIRSKHRLQRVAADAANNLGKRSEEDMMNMTRCKKRGGSVWSRCRSLRL